MYSMEYIVLHPPDSHPLPDPCQPFPFLLFSTWFIPWPSLLVPVALLSSCLPQRGFPVSLDLDKGQRLTLRAGNVFLSQK